MSIYEDTFLAVYCIVIAFILGSVFGSFLNCVSDRIIAHEKWWTGRSKCDACGHTLGVLDLFPVFSYLLLKGKCRYCGTRLSKTYVCSEALLGILFVIMVALHGTLDLILLRDLGFVTVLYGLSLSDLRWIYSFWNRMVDIVQLLFTRSCKWICHCGKCPDDIAHYRKSIKKRSNGWRRY